MTNWQYKVGMRCKEILPYHEPMTSISVYVTISVVPISAEQSEQRISELFGSREKVLVSREKCCYYSNTKMVSSIMCVSFEMRTDVKFHYTTLNLFLKWITVLTLFVSKCSVKSHFQFLKKKSTELIILNLSNLII